MLRLVTIYATTVWLAGCAVNPLTPVALPEAVVAVQTQPPTRTPTVTPTVTATPTSTVAPSAAPVWTLTVPPVPVARVTVAKEPLAAARAAPTQPAPGAEPAARMLDLINRNRAAAGLGPLARDEVLMGVAQSRAADMVARGYLGHDDPVTGAPLGREWMRAAGFTSSYLGENWYASGKAMPEAVDHAMTWFMGDAPHRANILGPNFVYVGVGIAFNGELWVMVQNFAGSNS